MKWGTKEEGRGQVEHEMMNLLGFCSKGASLVVGLVLVLFKSL